MDHQNETDMLDEFSNTLHLTDEDGNDVEFAFLDSIDYNGSEYVILLPTAEESAGQVVIMRVAEIDGHEAFIGVDNMEEADAVFDLFRKHAMEAFDQE